MSSDRSLLPGGDAAHDCTGLGSNRQPQFRGCDLSIDDDFDAMINSAYMVSKAAINRFTEALAAEARPHGICVFAISPGTVKTEMSRVAFADVGDDPDFWQPPELAADLIEYIGSGALDRFSGQYIRAAVDDWQAMGRG
jgi:NAD(P)-dependent dehydrogenase (short-subunit alcohol dehydrogenase family)